MSETRCLWKKEFISLCQVLKEQRSKSSIFGGAKLLCSLTLFTPKIETKLRPMEHFNGSVGAATCRFLFYV